MQAAGLTVNLIQLHQVIRAWWYAECCPKLKPHFQVAPAIVTWELWKRRNSIKHGGKAASTNRVVHEVNNTLHYLSKVRYNWLPNIPLLWPDKIRFFETYKPVVITKRFTWQLPHVKWFK